MRGISVTLLLAALAVGCSGSDSPDPEPEPAFVFHEVRPGVFQAVGTGAEMVGSNGAVVVTEEDVLVVDSHMTPSAARALLREMKTITDRPVRYLVNTHFHFDHVHGNQEFGPDVEILSHPFTREKIAAGGSQSGRAYDSFVKPTPDRIAEMEQQLETLDGEEREALADVLAETERVWAAVQETIPTPPTMTLTRNLNLHRGSREIQLHFFGRGHTGGDVVVYIPGEKALITGDLLTENLPYMGDAFFADWVETLEAVKSLEIDVILPGHGAALEGAEKLEHLQAYLVDLWEQGSRMHAGGLVVADAAEQIDLTAHAAHYPQIEGPGAPLHAVERMYELLEGR
jgi:glyoxylase-like metal-dependent hydrolase (beta-lactamase superfamily II)